MAFEGIDISIGGSAGTAKAAIASTRSSLGSLERSANSAKDSVEELGDTTTRTTSKVSALGATAGATALSLTGLSAAGTGASGSLTALGVSVGTATTALVGLSALLAPLVATLGAVTAAATGLATAFGAVVGSGLLAFGEKRAEQNEEQLNQINQRIRELEQLQETEEGLTDAQAQELEQLEEKADKVEETTTVTGALGAALGDLREEIQPLISELGQAFVPLIEDAFDAVPTLVEDIIDALGPLDQFADSLRAFGQAAMDAIPAAVGALVDLGRRALPIVADFLGTLQDGAGAALDAFVRVAEQVGDDLMQIGGAVGDLLPNLTELGVIIIEGVTPALTDFLGFVDDAIGAINDFAQSEGANDLLAGFGSVVDAVQPAVDSLASGLRSTVNALVEFSQSQQAAEILTAIEEAIIPLIPRVVELAGEFRPLISELVDNLPEIIRGVGAFADTVLDIANVVLPVIIPPLRVLIDLIGDLAGAYADWVEASEEAESQIGDAVPFTGNSADTREQARSVSSRSGPAASAGGSGIVGVASGGRVDRSGLAMLHAGERVVPEAQVSDRGRVESSISPEDIRQAFAGVSLELRGKLDVSGDVATMQDVDARLERAGRRANDRGIL
jgi:phage-related protein